MPDPELPICTLCGKPIPPDDEAEVSRGPLSPAWDKYHKGCALLAAAAQFDKS